MNKKVVLTAAIIIAVAIILGAFGAHGLKKIVSIEKVASFETGVRYQFYTGFSLLVLGLNSDRFSFSIKNVILLLMLGMFFFSFSIYFLALQDYFGIKLSFLGPITPIGGLLMIIAWGMFALNLARKQH